MLKVSFPLMTNCNRVKLYTYRHHPFTLCLSHVRETRNWPIKARNLSMQNLFLFMSQFFFHIFRRYPLALGNLADLESVESTPGRPTTQDLFKEAIKVSVEEYDDCHVYPYTYLGGHLHRAKDYEGAMANWMAAANVVSK